MEQIVSLKGISKAFSGVSILQNIKFNIKSENVHALIGGNGAGKSTLMKILSGLYQPDGGEIWFKGDRVSFKNPNDAHNKGIYLVPQEPMLYPYMSVEENIILGLPKKVNRKDIKEEILELMKSLNCNFKLNQHTEELTIAKQQQVELIRGLIRETDVIILDEPTSALTAKETGALFKNIKKLKKEKKIGFVYITHRLNELFEIADEVTILKDRKVVSSGSINNYTQEDIIKIMVPEVKKEKVEINVKQNPAGYKISNNYILEVENLSGKGFLDVSFKVRSSEIIGLTGVVGAGRTEVAETIFGLRKKGNGIVKFHGEELNLNSPKEIIDRGIVYVPEDRHLHGGFLEASIKHNISSSILYKLSKYFTNDKEEFKIASKYINTLNIKSNSENQDLAHLSGGNQQKVVLSKWLAAKPEIIILDEPTRGIDANAREEIYGVIRKLASGGIGVVIISSDFEEVSLLSDRVIVMYNGKTVAEIKPPNIDLENITFASFGHVKEVKAN